VDSDIGATHLGKTLEQSLEYINLVYSDYLEYGGLRPADFAGKRVLEIGPGDNLGVALRFYAAGAGRVVCLDKFFARRDAAQQSAIYRALRETLPASERERYDRAISFADGRAVIDAACVQYIYGVALERACEVLAPQSFDVIVSRAVLWEIYDPDPALRALDELLRPGGIMIHKIACLDWMFTQNGYHPLEFLTIPEAMYRWIARDSGKSNRRTIAHYRDAMRRLGYDAQFHITRTVGMQGAEFPPGVTSLQNGVHYGEESIELIRSIRPRLQPVFRGLPDEDLLVEDMFLVARRPAARSAGAEAEVGGAP